jgi:4-hydroxy-4-methyl-2-oxoglutarate aldolase
VDEADSVLQAAERRIEAEVAKRERLTAGELGMDIYNFREPLAAKGLKYE